MDFDAITLDTCILEKENFNLENGLLAKFEQFSRILNIEFIVSDVVLREIISLMEEKTKKGISNYNKALETDYFTELTMR